MQGAILIKLLLYLSNLLQSADNTLYFFNSLDIALSTLVLVSISFSKSKNLQTLERKEQKKVNPQFQKFIFSFSKHRHFNSKGLLHRHFNSKCLLALYQITYYILWKDLVFAFYQNLKGKKNQLVFNLYPCIYTPKPTSIYQQEHRKNKGYYRHTNIQFYIQLYVLKILNSHPFIQHKNYLFHSNVFLQIVTTLL